MSDFDGVLGGQLAVVTGQRDISTAAKAVKTYGTELDRLKVQFGYLNNQRLESAGDHDAWRTCRRWKCCGASCWVCSIAPASNLVRLLNTPASQMARVLQARQDSLGSAPAPGPAPIPAAS